MTKIIDQFIFDKNGIQLLGEEDFNDSMLVVNITQDVSICVETTEKTFQLAIFPDKEFEDKNSYPLSELGSVVRSVLAEKREESQSTVQGEMEEEDDDFMKVVHLGYDDADTNAQYLLRLSTREQLRLYSNVTINDTLNGKPLEGEELSDYLRNEVLSEEGKGAETVETGKTEDSFRAFTVPVTFFGDDFTLCFSPRSITVKKGNDVCAIPPTTEYHIVFNAMLELLSDEGIKMLCDWLNGSTID